jgi:hypothetical protein
MVLGDARRRARAELNRVLEGAQVELSEIRNHVAQNRELRRPFYSWKRQPGIAGTAANFIKAISPDVRRAYGR